MSKVFLITVKRATNDPLTVPPDRVMVEAAGPASALAAYAEEYVEVRALTAGEALKLHKEGVGHIDGTAEAATE